MTLLLIPIALWLGAAAMGASSIADGTTFIPTAQASLAHFRIKLFLAAPESFLPSALTAFGKHDSRLHFLRKLLSAAPASGLPFLSTDLFAHVSCAITGPIAKAVIMAAKRIGFMAPGKRRCRFHGGLSTGPKTEEGRARIAEAQRRRWSGFTRQHPRESIHPPG
jgi:hypothetical protein